MKSIVVGFGFFLLAVVGSGFYVWVTLPDVSILKTQYPALEYVDEDTPPIVHIVKHRPKSWVPIASVSKIATGAIIVSEDWAFFQHKGYDLNQIKLAVREDWEEGRFARGASTITQQVVRNVFLSKDKNLWRKAKELYLSMQIEKALNKRKILEVYLNIAEWGEGIYGIGPASQHYFGKPPSELTAKEGAFLAMLLPSPRKYSVSFRKRRLTDYAWDTIDSILDKMTQAHYLTEEDRSLEGQKPLPFEELPSESAL